MEVKGRIQQYIYYPSGPSEPVHGELYLFIFTFIFSVWKPIINPIKH
jgi:hypothetical protein